MASHRLFWLKNGNGETYKLTDKSVDCFLSSPKNLGFSKTLTTETIGARDVVKAEQYKLNDITGTLNFYAGTSGDKYRSYHDFARFVQFQPLMLYYQPAGFSERNAVYSEVVITKLEKSEVNNSSGILECGITFKQVSHWISNDYKELVVRDEFEGEGKTYPLNRPYSYGGSTLSMIPVFNTGFDDIGFVLEVEGRVVNPAFRVIQNNEVYGVCKLNGTFDYAKVDSNDSSNEILLKLDGSVLSNPFSYQDFTISNGRYFVTFVKLKPGQNYISFSHDGDFTGSVKIGWAESFITV